jgi:hypothetical protein
MDAAMTSTTYHREQRAAIVAACLYPVLFAAVMFCEVLPWLRAMLEAA